MENRPVDRPECCTLAADAFAERRAWIRHEILPHARAARRLPDGLAVELDAAPGLAERLDRLIALEAACCAGVDFARVPSAAPGRLRLEMRGIDPDASVFRSLGAEAGPRAPRRLSRAGLAGGLGVAASLVVCCLLPLAAAPLAFLDAPGPIAAGALLAGAGAWWWLGREACGSDC